MLNKDQQDAIAKARAAALALKSQADKARTMGLTVLEQWLREASVGCQAGADFQVRAMGDNLSTQTARVVVDREAAKKADDVTTSPMIEGGEKQADAIADTMKRRGLVK
jgi:hypothetical protein